MAFSAARMSRLRHPRIHLGVALLAGFACLTPSTIAQPASPRSELADPLPSQHATVIVDHQPAPTNTRWEPFSPHKEELSLRPRQRDDDEDEDEDEDADETETSSTDKKTTATEEDSSPARTTTTELSITQAEPTGEPSPLPGAFDGAIKSEFKIEDEDDSCPNFISDLLGSKDFERCYPFSMMLQTSSGFFQAQRQLVSIVRVLDATCKADIGTCSEFMRDAAQNLTRSENCEAEWKQGLTTVMQAYRGLMAYEMMYTATCLQDPETENYCFATAVTNTSTPSDTYLYFLPYNLSMPGASTPSCTWCNQETMGIFHAASSNRRQLIATTYEGAARQVNTMCGQAYVNSTLPEEDEGVGGITLPQSSLTAMMILAGVALNFLL